MTMELPLLESDVAEIVDRLGSATRAFSGKAVVLSGGCGFLGRYFLEVFAKLNTVLEEPCRLWVLDNLITAGRAPRILETAEHCTFVAHDVVRPFDPKGKVDFIIHAAGIASPYYYRKFPLETIDVAIHGTRNMLDLAREQGARLLFFSSSEIYGDPDPYAVPTPEGYRGNVSCQGPRACYDESKRLGEVICYIYHELHAVDARVVRPFNVYGPGMREDDYRVLPSFATSLLAGRPLRVYGRGRQTRTFTYVTDALTGFFQTLLHGAPGGTYNIGQPEPEISMLGLVYEIERARGHKVSVELVPYPEGYPGDEPTRRCPDISKARRELGYVPRVGIEDGLRRYLGWAERHYSSGS